MSNTTKTNTKQHTETRPGHTLLENILTTETSRNKTCWGNAFRKQNTNQKRWGQHTNTHNTTHRQHNKNKWNENDTPHIENIVLDKTPHNKHAHWTKQKHCTSNNATCWGKREETTHCTSKGIIETTQRIFYETHWGIQTCWEQHEQWNITHMETWNKDTNMLKHVKHKKCNTKFW